MRTAQGQLMLVYQTLPCLYRCLAIVMDAGALVLHRSGRAMQIQVSPQIKLSSLSLIPSFVRGSIASTTS